MTHNPHILHIKNLIEAYDRTCSRLIKYEEIYAETVSKGDPTSGIRGVLKTLTTEYLNLEADIKEAANKIEVD